MSIPRMTTKQMQEAARKLDHAGMTALWEENKRLVAALAKAQEQLAEMPDKGTEKLLRTLLDRAYKMMLMAGYRVTEHDPDQNDPIGAWMSDARVVLYGSGCKPDLGNLT